MVSDINNADSGLDSKTTRQRIIQAASQVFSDSGYTGATTRAIAAAAGVNEVTIFRQFGSKKKLMLEVVQRESALAGISKVLKEKLTGNYRKDLYFIGFTFLNVMLEKHKEILTSITEAGRIPEIREIIAVVPRMQNQMLGDYIRRQIANGVMRKVNPEAAAQAFFGMFMSYSIMLGLAGDSAPKIPVEAVVNQLVDIFIKGIIKK
jgi:TetR/AcrR family transcriptional repressor of mexJK operon